MSRKKKFIISCVAVLFSYQIIVAQDCEMGTTTALLEGNNVKAMLSNSGNIFASEQSIYQFPANQFQNIPASTIYSASVWVGGIDPAGNLKLAANSYGPYSDKTDFYPGPLHEEWGMTDVPMCTAWDRMFTMSKASIDAHKADSADNGVIDGPIPDEILYWPGRLNSYAEEAYGIDLDRTHMAPFYDRNSDGIYSPQEGDYPNIKDATSAVWWVINDAGGIHYSSLGDPIRMQFNYLAYSYASEDETINNSTFYSVTMINRGIESIDSLFASVWVDPQLGCYVDDYIGSIPEENLAFIYNSDDVDGDESCFCDNGVTTYCEEPPIMTIKILEGLYNDDYTERNGMSSFMYYNNGSYGNPNPLTTDPTKAIEYYRLMNARWNDSDEWPDVSSPLTYGASGFNPNSTDYTSFAYSAETAQGTWHMCLNEDDPGDKRMLITTGPARMEPQAVNDFTFVITNIPNALGPCDGALPTIIETSNTLDELSNNTVAIKELFLDNHSITIAPNPMTDYTTFDFGELTGKIDQVELYTVDGKLVRSYNDINNELVISKVGLNPGMYFYKVRMKSKQLISGKIMVL